MKVVLRGVVGTQGEGPRGGVGRAGMKPGMGAVTSLSQAEATPSVCFGEERLTVLVF